MRLAAKPKVASAAPIFQPAWQATAVAPSTLNQSLTNINSNEINLVVNIKIESRQVSLEGDTLRLDGIVQRGRVGQVAGDAKGHVLEGVRGVVLDR